MHTVSLLCSDARAAVGCVDGDDDGTAKDRVFIFHSACLSCLCASMCCLHCLGIVFFYLSLLFSSYDASSVLCLSAGAFIQCGSHSNAPSNSNSR